MGRKPPLKIQCILCQLCSVMLCEGAQGNAFRRVRSAPVGSCRVRFPKEMHSGGSDRVVSCEGAQGHAFGVGSRTRLWVSQW